MTTSLWAMYVFCCGFYGVHLCDHLHPDLKSSNKPVCGPHDQHPAGNPSVPSAIKHRQPGHHHTGQPVQGRAGTAEPRHHLVLDSRQHLEAFERDPNTYAMLLPLSWHALCLLLTIPSSAITRFQDDEDLNWSLIAEEWPTFLYDERAGWNRGDVRKGLFCGHVLIRVGFRL